MAKVTIDGDSVCIRVGLLERVVLAERTRRVPLARIRSVDARPPLADMMVHWSDQSGVWLCGVSAYDGHMVPSAKNPANTLAIDVEGEEPSRIYIEVDDESPQQTAERISRALQATGDQQEDPMTKLASSHEARADFDVDLDEDVQLRDPLMQGSLPPPPMLAMEPAPEMKLDDDRDLARLGGWLVGLGSLGLLTGIIMVAGGALPGLLAVGAGVACALLGGVALAVVAHHQS
jgi:hypothetical protein